jgi:chromosome segregation ATPase
LLTTVTDQRNERIALEREILELRASNRNLDQQLQDHAQANEQAGQRIMHLDEEVVEARQRITRLNEEVLGLTRVNNTTLTQLVDAQRQIIEMQRKRLDEIEGRLNEQ